GLLSRAGWTLFDDSGSVLWTHDNTWIEPRPDHALQDWYFFGYGHDYKRALADYMQFGGRVPLLPRFALGAWWSRYWAYTDQDLHDLVTEFRIHDLPLDVLVIDMDWHLPGWTGYTWNRDFFPDPAAFLKWVHEQGLRATLNLHPADGIGTHEKVYPEFARAMSIDTGERLPFRIADPQFVQHYFELLHHPLEDQGVDFWWIDWQQGESSEMKGLDPLLWLNHLHFHDSTRRGLRPMLYSRWGGLGNHRYHIGFSGDTYATWDALAFQPYMTATAANVLYGWWSHDIGGHIGATEPELFARWVQFGAMSPCLRLHSTKDPLAERRPWAFPEAVFEACKAAYKLRYQLVPYLYAMAYVASQTGISLCRPMYYEHPDEESAYVARYQYYLGDQIIAAPIVHPADPTTGLASADVWLPAGQWIDFQTRTRLRGGRWVRLTGDLSRMPMLVKAGGIIPLAAPAQTTDAIPKDRLIVSVFPGADGAFDLFEDDGITETYAHDQFEITPIRLASQGTMHTLTIAPVTGHADGLPAARSLELRFAGIQQPPQITVNGVPVVFEYSDQTAIVRLAACRKHETTTLVVDAELTVSDPSVAPPFVQTIEYTTVEEASQQFGTVLVAAPSDGSAFDAEITWSVTDGRETKTTVRRRRETIIARCPFAFDGTPQTLRWRADTRVTWGDQGITSAHRSKVVFPTIPRWQFVTYDHPEPKIEDVVDPNGQPNPNFDWKLWEQRPADMQNIDQPSGLVLSAPRSALAPQPRGGFVLTRIDSHADRELVVGVWIIGSGTIYLNGLRLDPVSFTMAEPLNPIFAPWHGPRNTYYPSRLHAGKNTLVVHTRPASELRPWWGVGAALFEKDGRIAVL
ncbi:MAG TPA: TIM-barrel domain-containing protein, partial [Aggregatilineales bacterium]|nr:TIM-barrel domain-containing protein [Aggregatilineales bacterium]